MYRFLIFMNLGFFPIMRLMGDTVDSSFFSESYSEARKRLLQAVWAHQKMEGKVELFELPLESDQKEKLHADAFYYPANYQKKKLLILSSGIHGAEAPLGSALQLKFLTEILPGLRRDSLGILLLHSLNPYGFVTGRRVTENNVDLNRNFFSSEATRASTQNHDYDEYKEILAPSKSVRSYWFDSLRLLKDMVFVALKKEDRRKFTHAFAGGQYADPKGIYYGAKVPEPQVGWVQNVLEKCCSDYEEVLLYDIHTGLGKALSLQMISSLETKSENAHVRKFEQLYQNESGISFVSPYSQGFYVTTGDFTDYVFDFFKARKVARLAAYTAEFGTLGDSTLSQISTSVRIILENRGHHWGFSSPSLEQKVKRNFRELFNPSQEEWRKQALSLGSRALKVALHEELSPSSVEPAQKAQ